MERLLLLGCKCRSPYCSKCGRGYFGKVEASVAPHLGMFKKARLLTLTVDRENFESGEAAYKYVKRRGLIRNLMRRMGFRKGFKVLAFHKNEDKQGRDGREWPHWHVVVDLADGPRGWVDMALLWHLWRDEWKVGGVDLRLKDPKRCGWNGEVEDLSWTGEQAVRYAIGYCQFQAGVVASWVLDSSHNIRGHECYGELRVAVAESERKKRAEYAAKRAEFFASCDESGDTSENLEPAELSAKCARRRTLRERQTVCGRGSTVVREREYPDGSKYYKYLGKVDLSPGQLAYARKCGLADDWGIQVEVRDFGESALLRVFEPVAFGEAEAAFDVLKSRCERVAAKSLPDVEDDSFGFGFNVVMGVNDAGNDREGEVGDG